MTTDITPHDLVPEAIDKLCEIYIADIREYYRDDVSVESITPFDLVRSVLVSLKASASAEVYLVFELDYDMVTTALEVHLTDIALAGSILIACQVELSRYQRIAGVTAHV